MSSVTFRDGTAALQTGPMHYADPYPPSWMTAFHADVYYGVEYAVGDTTSLWPLFTGVGYGDALSALADNGPLRPRLTPPQALQLNGRDGQQKQTGLGHTVEVSWTPPRVGAPTGYSVRLHGLDATTYEGRTFPAYLFTIFTEANSVSVVLPTDTAYEFFAVAVTAVWETNSQAIGQPHQRSYPSARAEAVSSKWGRWGSLEYLEQPRSESPKFDALQSFIESNPRWW